MKTRFLCLVILSILASGCGVSGGTARNDHFKIGKTTMISNYKVFQTLNSGFGLATNPYNGMTIAVKSATQFFPIYDGEIISGTVVMTDTYTYESIINEDTGRTFSRTVPLVVPYKEYSGKKQFNTEY